MRTVSQQSTISISTTIMAGKDPVASEMANEVVILDPNSGIYFGLDHVGVKIWELIQEPTSVKDIRDTILEEYDVEVGRCEQDLFSLFQAMSNHGLIELRN